MIRVLLLIVFLALIIAFTLQNMDQLVILHTFFGVTTRPIPVALTLLGAFAVGAIVAVILTLPGWITTRLELRRQRKTIRLMEEELSRHVRP